MAEQVVPHETRTDMVKPSPSQVDASIDIALKVKVSCPQHCDLQGNIVMIVNQDARIAKEVELTQFDGTVNQTDEFVVKAPIEPGGYTWTAVFAAREREGVIHEASSAPFSFIVKPHATNMAVWAVPCPIAFGDEFSVNVGVKCSAECDLTANEVEIYDDEGARVATGTLGGTPWSGTSALYWAEVELKAPDAEGYYEWVVKFRNPHLELPHEDASYNFGFTVARPPEHVLTVEVIAQHTKTPVQNASVLLRRQGGCSYRGYTDEAGVAKVDVAKGAYTLYASKGDEYETLEMTVEITKDVRLAAELQRHYAPFRATTRLW